MRAAAATLLLLLAVSTAVAGSADDERIVRARAEAEAAHTELAAAALLELQGADHDLQAKGAKLALEILPYERGNAVAAALVLDVLRAEPSHPDAWQLGYGLRRRVRDGLDVEHGEPFLRSMVEMYPDYARFKYALADLLYGAGRPVEAEAIYTQIIQEVPDDTHARYTQALLRELAGDAEASLDIYDEIIERKLDLWAHRYKVKLLWDVRADYAAAEVALEEALVALDEAPPGRARDEIRAQLEWDEKLLEGRREERAKLADADSRTDRILFGLLGGWVVFLGGGVALLRRRRLL